MQKSLELALSEYYSHGFSLLCDYRDRGVYDMPIAEYYKNRLGDGYVHWESLKLHRNPNKLYSGILEWDIDSLSIDVSDEYFNELTDDKRLLFLEREKRRRKNGIWVDTKAFLDLPEEERIKERELDPLFGKVQLMTGAHYFMMFYTPIRIQDDVEYSSTGITMGYFNRKNAQMFDVLEILERYPLVTGVNRQGMFATKPRSCFYTTSIHAFLLRGVLYDSAYDCATTIDNQDKVSKDAKKFFEMYENIPEWLKKEAPYHQRRFGLSDATISIDRLTTQGISIENKFVVTHAKPKALEGGRYKVYRAEEIGLYEHDIDETLARAGDTMKGSASTRVGLFIGGGVMSKGNRNIDKLKAINRNPAAYDVFVFFQGVQHFKLTDKVTGWPEEEKVLEDELQKRKDMEHNLEALQMYVIQNAINPDECFYTLSSSMINVREVMQHIRALENEIANGTLVIQRGWFEINPDNYLKPIWRPHPSGGWYITQHPHEQVKHGSDRPQRYYVAGADNFQRIIDANEARVATEKRGVGRYSVQAVVVQNTITKEPVALYVHRYSDPKQDYEQSLLGCLYYNMMILPEYNKEGQVLYFLEHKHTDNNRNYPKGFFTRYLLPTPPAYRKRNTLKWGIDTTSNKRNSYMTYVVPYLEKNLRKIPFPELLRVLADWDIEDSRNTPDEGMAFMITQIANAFIDEYNPVQRESTNTINRQHLRSFLVNSQWQ